MSNKKNAKTISELTDRELNERMYNYIKSTQKDVSAISSWVQIWSWLGVIALALLLFRFMIDSFN